MLGYSLFGLSQMLNCAFVIMISPKLTFHDVSESFHDVGGSFHDVSKPFHDVRVQPKQYKITPRKIPIPMNKHLVKFLMTSCELDPH